MHPELINNSVFLRYYKQWQDDPLSIVFVPIVEYFLGCGLVDEALKVCREGLKRHPTLVSGRIAMAKIHIKFGNWEEAQDELKTALTITPANKTAIGLIDEVNLKKGAEEAGGAKVGSVVSPPVSVERPHSVDPSWNTITMAHVYESQGHYAEARSIYEGILKGDPGNEAAALGLNSLFQIVAKKTVVKDEGLGQASVLDQN